VTVFERWMIALVGGVLAALLGTIAYRQLSAQEESTPEGWLVIDAGNGELVIVQADGHGESTTLELEARLRDPMARARLEPVSERLSPQQVQYDEANDRFVASTSISGAPTSDPNLIVSDSAIVTYTVDGRIADVLVASDVVGLEMPVPSPTGDALLFAHGVHSRIDASTFSTTYELMRADEDGCCVRGMSPSLAGAAAWDPTGARFAYPCSGDGFVVICLMDADGEPIDNSAFEALTGVDDLAWRPNSDQIVARAFMAGSSEQQFRLLDLSDGTVRTLAEDRRSKRGAAWSPGGRYLAFLTPTGAVIFDTEDGSEQLRVRGEFVAVQWTSEDPLHGSN
jgi:hypothetical protein